MTRVAVRTSHLDIAAFLLSRKKSAFPLGFPGLIQLCDAAGFPEAIVKLEHLRFRCPSGLPF